ncbi:MAG: UDP-N-acetylmuramoyl-L-alanyl-D-glutamate--2,6-diaminopimelate ligase [Geminicoccaceae bacterium]|nr:MAG: UDP-N-acetylmuramoyl-L-alanyl-D-glutamate--2,6-diaminopimelate ligase [Geminicoccaceae bacterium]
MRLASLVAEEARLVGDGSVEVTGLSVDSRTVRPGHLFAALRGTRSDGRRFLPEAVAKGAVAVLGDRSLERAELPVPAVIDDDPRRRLARMAALFFRHQPATCIAVTGTNGKTSTVSFLRQLWAAAGLKAGSLGTLGLTAPGYKPGPSLTTPDPIALHELLANLARDGVQHLAMEASSHGLDQRRLDGVKLTAAAFLNLTRDHLDYHGSEAAYLAAKWRLFDVLLPAGAPAILNADMPGAPDLVARAQARGLEVVTFGCGPADYRLVEQVAEPAGQLLTLDLRGERCTVHLPIVGVFQASNLLAALALGRTSGLDHAAMVQAIPALAAPEGRMERVGVHPRGAAIFVDYAHTPDALSVALQALRPHCMGRLWVVFGAGGDRDPGKRPLMGAAARDHADHVVVTDDNPRSEPPALIRQAILRACPEALEIGDRSAAIHHAVQALEAGDVLLVAGKGHEQGQIVGDRVLPFDDTAVVSAALVALGGRP